MNFNKHLEKLKQEVNLITSLVKGEFLTLDPVQLNFRAEKNQWSILECFEHLNRYYRFYIPEIRSAISKARPDKGDIEVSSTWIGRLSIRMMHPDNKSKKKTFKHMNPIHSELSIATINEFLNFQEEMILLIESAKGFDLNSRLVRVEFLKMLRMNLAESMEFVVIHIKRHVYQAEAISKRIPSDSILVL
jgi:hypothetical protein